MTLKTFTRELRRGLGSAIVELKANHERGKYRNIVMRACLSDIAYDTQVEGTKGHYLYTAIKTFENHEDFIDKMIEKFRKKICRRLSEQIIATLCCFSDDGCKKSADALIEKYIYLKNRLPKDSSLWLDGREQFENLMTRRLDNEGFEFFKQAINDMGEMILEHGNDDCVFYDCFLYVAEETFGKKIYTYIENEKHKNVAEFYRFYKSLTSIRAANTFQNKEKITIEFLINYANELLEKSEGIPFAITGYAKRFVEEATEKELEELAHAMLDEPNEFIKTALSRAFIFVDFPLDIDLLLPYTASEYKWIRDAVVGILSRLKNSRIRKLALQMFESKDIESALDLIKLNFEIEDNVHVRKHIRRIKRVSFRTIGNIEHIYNEHKSVVCGDVLLHLYKNAECSHCRYAVVGMMIDNNLMPQKILEECRYDSYGKTRELAKRRYL